MNARSTAVGSGMWSGRFTVALAAAAVAATDLTSKAVAEARLTNSSIDLGLLQLRLGFNSGMAFNLGDNFPRAVIVALTAAITIAIAAYAWHRSPQAGTIERIAGGAAVGGALANVIDRGRDGVVTDYLHTGWWPTFNLAELFLVLGFMTVALMQVRHGASHDAPAVSDTAPPERSSPEGP